MSVQETRSSRSIVLVWWQQQFRKKGGLFVEQGGSVCSNATFRCTTSADTSVLYDSNSHNKATEGDTGCRRQERIFQRTRQLVNVFFFFQMAAMGAVKYVGSCMNRERATESCPKIRNIRQRCAFKNMVAALARSLYGTSELTATLHRTLGRFGVAGRFNTCGFCCSNRNTSLFLYAVDSVPVGYEADLNLLERKFHE